MIDSEIFSKSALVDNKVLSTLVRFAGSDEMKVFVNSELIISENVVELNVD